VIFILKWKQTLSRRFTERLNAFGAQSLLDHAALLHYRHLLKVGFESTIGRIQGE
jgi:hypothetical protein